MMRRASTLSRSILSALRLMDLGKGKSVSQIGSEFELSNSDVVCVLMPFVRASLVGRRTVTEDWRDDIYYSLNYEREVPPAHTEEELRKLKDEVAKSKSELRSLQGEVARKEESMGKARHLDSTKDFQLGEGKRLAQIASETGMSPAKIQQLIEPLVKSGDVVQKYISQGQFYYVPAKKLRDFIPNVTEEEIKIVALHHHVVPVPYSGREINVLEDAGDVLELLLRNNVQLVLMGHRHVQRAIKINNTLFVNAGTLSCVRTRARLGNSFNVIDIGEDGAITVQEVNLTKNTKTKLYEGEACR